MQQFDRPDLLPTFAGVGNPWKLRPKGRRGAKFNIKTCNSTSLGHSAYTDSSCSHNGCYLSYYDFVQIKNPYTGHCLTTKTWNASVTELDFVVCVSNATNTAQLWLANQYVYYTLGFSSLKSYGPVTIDPIQRTGSPPFGPLYPPFFAFYISTQDNKTLEVIQYDYTQRGVLLSLVQF